MFSGASCFETNLNQLLHLLGVLTEVRVQTTLTILELSHVNNLSRRRLPMRRNLLNVSS